MSTYNSGDMNPKVSVIITNYNHAQYLEERIQSVLSQTYTDFELIVLDDCSSDNSVEIIRNMSFAGKRDNVRFYFNETNSGNTYMQWKKGISLAKGDYIWIAESDDFSPPHYLEKTLNYINENNLDLCFTQSMIIDENGKEKGVWDKGCPVYKTTHVFGREVINTYLVYKNLLPNASAVVFKKDLAEKVIDEVITYRINGDWFLWINLINEGRCGYISEPLNHFRRHSGASSQRNVLNFKNVEEAFRIQLWLKAHHYSYDTDYWVSFWMRQNSGSVSCLLRNNFRNIYKVASKLRPFVILTIIKLCALQKLKR